MHNDHIKALAEHFGVRPGAVRVRSTGLATIVRVNLPKGGVYLHCSTGDAETVVRRALTMTLGKT